MRWICRLPPSRNAGSTLSSNLYVHTTCMPYNLYGIQPAVDAFLDRVAELRALEQSWASPGANLTLVWGRRRAGKTRLLGRFLEGKPAVFYGATQQATAAELAGFSQAAREGLAPSGTDLLAHDDFPSWQVAFEYLAERAAGDRLAVVLDEFPYLVESDPALPSVLQRFWDQRGRRSRLQLILCGSARSIMLKLQSENAPLFGRVDTRLHVRPFGYAEAGLFLPDIPPAERAIAYPRSSGACPPMSRDGGAMAMSRT